MIITCLPRTTKGPNGMSLTICHMCTISFVYGSNAVLYLYLQNHIKQVLDYIVSILVWKI